ncbi:MAG: HNH endonuclease [Candidatus Thiodiazotropha sp.]
MNVISEKNEVLNASVSLETIDGVFGLVMESRGGAKGKPNERNTDYSLALDTMLSRLKSSGIGIIRIQVVSSKALKIWNAQERTIEIEGKSDIPLKNADLKALRGKISKAQKDKKENSKSRGGNSTKRILIEANLQADSWKNIVTGTRETTVTVSEGEIESVSIEFKPEDAEAEKEKISRSVALRRGQPKFRKKLLSAYQNICAVTGTSFPPILEAAHIVPYMGENTNHVTNGILLRADIHTLFDLGLLGFNQEYEVVISSSLKNTEYEAYNGKKLHLPKGSAEQPSLSALKSRPIPGRH